MRVVLPSNQKEITLGQFQDYLLLLTKVDDLKDDEFNNKKISIFCDIDEKTLTRVPKKDIDGLLEQIDIALSVTVDFKDRFTLNGIEFGFIPNFDDITTGVFVDLQKYSSDFKEGLEDDLKELCNSFINMHKVMSILFRPVDSTDVFNNYTIKSYNGTKENSNAMKDMPLCYVNAAMVFFSSLDRKSVV